jgi:hypothetical protein
MDRPARAGSHQGRHVLPLQSPLDGREGRGRDRDHDWDDEPITVGEAYRSVDIGLGLALFRIGKGWVWIFDASVIGLMLLGLLWVSVEPAVSAIVEIVGLVVLVATSVMIEFRLEDWVNEYNEERAEERKRQRVESRRRAEVHAEEAEETRSHWG